MIIDGGMVRTGLRAVALAGLALGGWALVMVAMPFVGPAGRQVAVVGGGSAAVRAVTDAGGRIVEIRRGAVLARSDARDFPQRLYAAGAPLVIEGHIAAGCFAKAGA
jgi:hypothetical protein